jgi:hypothetical protein
MDPNTSSGIPGKYNNIRENRQNTPDFELWPADCHVVVSFRQNTTPIFDPVKSQVSFPRKN